MIMSATSLKIAIKMRQINSKDKRSWIKMPGVQTFKKKSSTLPLNLFQEWAQWSNGVGCQLPQGDLCSQAILRRVLAGVCWDTWGKGVSCTTFYVSVILLEKGSGKVYVNETEKWEQELLFTRANDRLWNPNQEIKNVGTREPKFFALWTVSLLHLWIHHSGVFCKIQARVSRDLENKLSV